MIIKGERTGGARRLADYLLNQEHNESALIRAIGGYPKRAFAPEDLKTAFALMAAHGESRGKRKTLYHSIISLQAGENLDTKQLDYVVNALALSLGMKNHQYIVVEHRKTRGQHFHILFDILNPNNGKQAKLNWTRNIEWRLRLRLEKELGLSPEIPKGRSMRFWEIQRGRRSGINPQHVRKDVTAIYRSSLTGKDFIGNLKSAGYATTVGKWGYYVIVDKAGDIHGLLRRIEGVSFKDLSEKFPDLKNLILPSLTLILEQKRSQDIAPAKVFDLPEAIKQFEFNARQICMPRNKIKAVGTHMMFETSRPESMPFFIPQPHDDTERGDALSEISSETPSFAPDRQDKATRSDTLITDEPPMSPDELIAWAWAHGRFDILVQHGFPLEMFEPQSP